MINKNDIARVRSLIEANLGKRVKLSVKKGRKKVIVRYGVLLAVYPHTFNLDLESLSEFAETNRLLSLNYADILTHSVSITVMDTDFVIE